MNCMVSESKFEHEWIQREKMDNQRYYEQNPDSLIPLFENELKACGFEFEVSSQTLAFMPKYKKHILPIALKYYLYAKEIGKENEQNHFLRFFCYRGIDEVVPMLIDDMYAENTTDLTKWCIADCLFKIRSRLFFDDYLRIVLNKELGRNRKMVVLLLGKLKIEDAIPVLVDLLEDAEMELHALMALSEFKKNELKCYFERYTNAKQTVLRKQAKIALKKLEETYT